MILAPIFQMSNLQVMEMRNRRLDLSASTLVLGSVCFLPVLQEAS